MRSLASDYSQETSYVSAFLRDYCRMLSWQFESTFSPVSITEALYTLKRTERAGWAKRQLSGRIESVAEHTFGALVLALMFLPESSAIDKHLVLRMLMAHDLAESITGDTFPDETPQFETEARAYRMLAASGPTKGLKLSLKCTAISSSSRTSQLMKPVSPQISIDLIT